MNRAHLLIVDPQNDFCDLPESLLPQLHGERLRPALAVPGAHADMQRLAALVDAAGDRLSDITVTLDSHAFVAIERTTFWRDASGQEVPPFTRITAACVAAGIHVPVNGQAIEAISGKPLTERVIELLTRLEQAGRYTLMAWPVHCVTGSWGACIHPELDAALRRWERHAAAPVRKVHKGEYPLAEQYGVFEAETPLEAVPSTCFNRELASSLLGPGTRLLVAGEASSHCVAASIEQLLAFRGGDGRGIMLITDCMSPVAGFEAGQNAFFQRARAAGVALCRAEEALLALSQ